MKLLIKKTYHFLINLTINIMENTPNLMPGQFKPFNGDSFIADKFLKLKKSFNLDIAVETGTCLGGTTKFLSENYKEVYTVEINKEWQKKAIDHCNATNITFISGNSANELGIIARKLTGKKVMFYLDSHWQDSLPLIEELIGIATSGLKPVIAIHDFLVPEERKLNFDVYKGQKLEFAFIKDAVVQIYGKDGYHIEYNSFDKSEYPNVGIIFITLKI